jgi:hypothetical protein
MPSLGEHLKMERLRSGRIHLVWAIPLIPIRESKSDTCTSDGADPLIEVQSQLP